MRVESPSSFLSFIFIPFRLPGQARSLQKASSRRGEDDECMSLGGMKSLVVMLSLDLRENVGGRDMCGYGEAWV